MGLRRSGQSDLCAAEALARATCRAVVREGETKHQNARQSHRRGGPTSGRSLVLDVEEARSLSRTKFQTQSSFVDARVSATAPWPSRPLCECDTRIGAIEDHAEVRSEERRVGKMRRCLSWRWSVQ